MKLIELTVKKLPPFILELKKPRLLAAVVFVFVVDVMLV